MTFFVANLSNLDNIAPSFIPWWCSKDTFGHVVFLSFLKCNNTARKIATSILVHLRLKSIRSCPALHVSSEFHPAMALQFQMLYSAIGRLSNVTSCKRARMHTQSLPIQHTNAPWLRGGLASRREKNPPSTSGSKQAPDAYSPVSDSDLVFDGSSNLASNSNSSSS